MGRSTKKQAEIARRQLKVSGMYLKGFSQTQIAIKMKVSQAAISKDIHAMMDQWRADSQSNIEDKLLIELAKIDKLETVFWDAWYRSLRKTKDITQAIESEPTIKGKNDGTLDPVYEKAMKIVKVTDTKRENTPLGEVRFLAGVEWCIEARCKLLHISAPTDDILKHIDMNQLTTDQLRRIAAGEDVIKVLLTTKSSQGESGINPA